MVQTTSKKIVRSSEKQKPRAYVPHVPYVKTEGFVQGVEPFWGFEKQPALFQVARKGVWEAIVHPTSELKVSSKLRIAYCILFPIYNLIFSNCSLEQ